MNANAGFAGEVIDNGVYEGEEHGVEFYTYEGKLWLIEIFPLGGVYIEQVRG